MECECRGRTHGPFKTSDDSSRLSPYHLKKCISNGGKIHVKFVVLTIFKCAESLVA